MIMIIYVDSKVVVVPKECDEYKCVLVVYIDIHMMTT